MPEASIAVMVPTMRRPDSLARALRSVFAQDRPELIAEIVVVDNSPEASARETVDALRPASPRPLIYVHEPRPGVATARNAGLASTRAALIAFLDDDEEAPPAWLGLLHQIHRRHYAAVTFGPVRGVTPASAGWAGPYLDRFFSRLGPAESGPTDTAYGCGNSLMTRERALLGPAPFDAGADETGGEDDRLFAGLKAQGCRFAWAAEAYVYEHAPADRARMSYALWRAFGYGQTPSELCARAGDWPGVAKWMLVGAVQLALYGIKAALLWIVRSPARAEAADRAARGLGKICWWSPQRFYGQAALMRRGGGGGSGRKVIAGTGAGGASRGIDSLTAMHTNVTQTKS